MKTDRSHFRQLGPGGPLVPPLGLGSWQTWDRMSRDDAMAAITLATEHNAGLFDIGADTSGPHLDEMSTTDVDFGTAFRESGVARDDATTASALHRYQHSHTPTTHGTSISQPHPFCRAAAPI